MGTKYFREAVASGVGVISENPASLRECFGFNKSIAPIGTVPILGQRFFQLFNKSTAPVNDDIPEVSVSVPGFAQFTIDLEEILWAFPSGIAFGFSADPDKYDDSVENATGGWVNAIFESLE